MKKLRYKKVNAFTGENAKGNPAAYLCVDNAGISPEEMLRIGKEHSGFVSEVVFCSDSKCAACKLTYYSSECEVDFCGHGTIAAMYDLIANDESLLSLPEIRIETNRKGTLCVYNSIPTDNAVYITAPQAQCLPVPATASNIADALGISVCDLEERLPIACIDAGLKTLLVPFKTLRKEISIYPDEQRLKAFCQAAGVDIILIFSMQTQDADCFAHTRVFAPKFGYLEDPATGSGNSAFANYLLQNKMWNGEPITVEQGGDNIVYNPVKLKFDGTHVLFGGSAQVVIDGYYFV